MSEPLYREGDTVRIKGDAIPLGWLRPGEVGTITRVDYVPGGGTVPNTVVYVFNRHEQPQAVPVSALRAEEARYYEHEVERLVARRGPARLQVVPEPAKQVTFDDLKAAFEEGWEKIGPFDKTDYALTWVLNKFDITYKEDRA